MLPDPVATASDRFAGSAVDPEQAEAAGVSAGAMADADQATAQLGRLLTALADPVALKGLSLARLSKRCALPMSSLRRLLTGLEDAGLVGVTLTEDGRGSAVLTQAGRTLAASLVSESA